MLKSISTLKTNLLWCVLAALLATALYNQFSFSLKPLYLSRSQIVQRVSHNDMQKLEIAAPDLFNMIQAVNSFPASTHFYFIPCFDDSGNAGRWWWYVYLMGRYLSYPRTVFTHDKVQYENSKDVYLSRFIGQARTWQELDWITSRHIEVLILMRNNSIEFIKTTDLIKNL